MKRSNVFGGKLGKPPQGIRMSWMYEPSTAPPVSPAIFAAIWSRTRLIVTRLRNLASYVVGALIETGLG